MRFVLQPRSHHAFAAILGQNQISLPCSSHKQERNTLRRALLRDERQKRLLCSSGSFTPYITQAHIETKPRRGSAPFNPHLDPDFCTATPTVSSPPKASLQRDKATPAQHRRRLMKPKADFNKGEKKEGLELGGASNLQQMTVTGAFRALIFNRDSSAQTE